MLNPAYRRRPNIQPDKYVDPDPKKQEENARHLSKYIFPRQYGLANPFSGSQSKKNAFQIPDYSDRESEIKVIDFLPFICCILIKVD